MATQELDNRGLPPPEPMMRILEALGSLGTHDDLRVFMDREPLLLYPELERRGFAWDFGDQAGELVLTIRRAVT